MHIPLVSIFLFLCLSVRVYTYYCTQSLSLCRTMHYLFWVGMFTYSVSYLFACWNKYMKYEHLKQQYSAFCSHVVINRICWQTMCDVSRMYISSTSLNIRPYWGHTSVVKSQVGNRQLRSLNPCQYFVMHQSKRSGENSKISEFVDAC